MSSHAHNRSAEEAVRNIHHTRTMQASLLKMMQYDKLQRS